MDIKAKIEQIVNKLKTDKDLMAKFQKNPVAVVEELIGIDLPDDQINQVIEGIKSRVDLSKVDVGQAVGLLGKLKGLFGK